MKRDQVKELFKQIREFYGNFDVTSQKLDAWHKFLRNSNPAVVMKNLENHIFNEKFPPTIADLIDRTSRTNVLSEDETQELLKEMRQWERKAGRNH
jgi:hypothetical protein